MKVNTIKKNETYTWLIKKHYAKRLCPISYAFGVYVDDELEGIVTYGVPSSATLRDGLCGPELSHYVLELNRLCLNSDVPRNAASFLVGRSLKLLPKGTIVVSYADTAMGHVGYVYQATNFIYTGLSAKRTDWKIKGLEHLHGQTVADEFIGKKNRADLMRSKYGDDFYLQNRSRKHRYVYFTDKRMEKHLKYGRQNYPKGITSRYQCKDIKKTQKILF